jgi:hypothetical protein
MARISLAAILRSTFGTILTLLAGAGLVALMTVLVVTEVPDANRRLDAYNAARRCPSAPSEPAGCRWTQPFTVTAIDLTSKRHELDKVILTDAHGTSWKTAYTNRNPVLSGLDEGDRVTGTIWRGQVTEVAKDGESQDTDAAPDDLRARLLIFALIAIPPALLAMAACAWRLADKWTYRRAPRDPTPGMTATLGLAIAVLVGGLFCPLLVNAAGESFWPVAAAWLPLTALMTIATRIYVVKKRTRSRTAAPKQSAYK